MRVPSEKIEMLKRKTEEKLKETVVWSELQGSGRFCPYCKSMNLEHENKYPRFTGKAIIMMTKCLQCGMLFDEPEKSPFPYVVFKTESGKVVGYQLEKKDIED